MKVFWLPGISRYRLTEDEAKAEARVSPYNEAELPDDPQDMVDTINAMIAQHERTLVASDMAYEREEARARALGYPTLRAALDALPPATQPASLQDPA